MTTLTPRDALEVVREYIGRSVLLDVGSKADEALAVLTNLVERAGEPVAWLPIESAPKDGTRVITLFDSGYVAESSFHKTYDKWNVGGYAHLPWSEQPTHWQPLPTALGDSHAD